MNKDYKTYRVYKHTSPSGKYYIGITRQVVEKRWGNNGIKYFGKRKDGDYCQKPLVRAILKYGWDNIKHETLYDGLESYQAKILEIGLINEAKKLNLSYNIAAGGDGIIGVSHESWLKGKKMPDWIKQKLRGKKRSDEVRKEQSIRKKGLYYGPTKKVNIYTADGQYLDTFNSCIAVDRYLNLRQGKTSAVCTHIQKTIGGLQARFVDDNTPLLNIDYYTKTESLPLQLTDTITNNTYTFKTIQAACRYTKIHISKLLFIAHDRVKMTKDGITCKFLEDQNKLKAFRKRKRNQNNNDAD